MSDYCIEDVHDEGRGVGFHQCCNKAGHGKDGRYCRVHARKHPADGEVQTTFTRWRVDKYDKEPERLDVVRETDKTLFLANGDKRAKETWGISTFDTWEEARDAMLGKARRELAYAQERVDHLSSLKPPA